MNGLKNVFGNNYKVGAAVCRKVLENKDGENVVNRHFSSLTAENSMKFGLIHPAEDHFDWEETDFVANYARKNGFVMRGHTMLWHNQNPPWLFLDGEQTVSKTKLFKRLEDHIIAVSQRYKDIVYSWDVVNEAIDTDKGDENNMRQTDWYKICGKEIYDFAFKKMRELCPDAKLFYNDYNNEYGEKLESTIRFLSSMLDAGIPVDGIGLQAHWYYNFPDEKIIRNAIECYSKLGLEIEFTEVDVSAYVWSEARDKADFLSAMPQDRIKEQAKRYMDLFLITCDYPNIKNITTWGVADNHTWLDNFPVKERKNWPLLFDEQYREKQIVADLLEAGMKRPG